MAEKKETATRDANGVRKNNYRRFTEGKDYEKQTGPDMVALCELMSVGIFGQDEETPTDGERGKGGRPRKIETVEELNEGIKNYLQYIAEYNSNGVPLIPDVEGLALFLGISRSTLYEWQSSRPGEFSDTIKRALNAIAATKKQLALMGKIPPLVFATDFNNNHGYTQAAQKIDLNVGKQAEPLPEKTEILKRLPMGASDPADSDDEIL